MSKSNLIFILIDDLGWKDLGCYNSEFYETPNIDALAKKGVLFTSAYAAAPICSPTRASIMTGKYPARLGTTQWFGSFQTRGKLIAAPYIDLIIPEEKTIAKTLKEEGYKTIHIGKWHLGEEPSTPENHGFDVNIAGSHWGHPKYGYFSPYHLPNLEDGPKGEYLTDRLTNEAIKQIKDNKDNPFFMYLCYYAVHVPIQAPESLIEKYKNKAKSLGLDHQKTFEVGEKYPCSHKQYNKIIRRIIQSNPVYAAMIERLDFNIGRILRTLDELGIEENTTIIFFSDNGGLSSSEASPTSNTPLKEGKGWMYEGGSRVPLIIKWKENITPGSTCEHPIISTDFYPTILEMLGLPLKKEQHIDGMSIVPLLTGQKELEERILFWHYPHYSNSGGTPGSCVRFGDYKLIEFYEDNRMELYNTKDDIGERLDISKENFKKFNSLYNIMEVMKLRTEPAFPYYNSAYKSFRKEFKFKIMAFGYWLYTKLSPKFRKIRKNIHKNKG